MDVHGQEENAFGLRFLLEVRPAALYITKPKSSVRLWAGRPPPLERGVCGKLVIVFTMSMFVKSPGIHGAVSAAIGNFDPLYSKPPSPAAVCGSPSRTFTFTYGSN
jgi:hypothetical protein